MAALTGVVVPVVAVRDAGAVEVHLHEKVDALTQSYPSIGAHVRHDQKKSKIHETKRNGSKNPKRKQTETEK